MTTLAEINNQLKSLDEETRRGAVNALSHFPLSHSRDMLFVGIADESWRVRKEAVDIFVGLDPAISDVDALLSLLRNEENAGVRNSAVEALVRIGSGASASLQQLVADPDVDVRKFVIDTMGLIGSADFFAPLVSALDDSDVNVASAAAEHLASIGNPEAVPHLLRAAVACDNEFFRFNALAALGKLASPAPLPDALRLFASQEMLRKPVYECLGSIGDTSALSILLEGCVLRQKSSRFAAIKSLYRIISRSAGKELSKIEDELALLRSTDAVSAIAAALNDSDPLLGEAATVILGIIGDPAAAPALLDAYQRNRLAPFVAVSLQQIGAGALDTLLKDFFSLDDQERAALCTLVGKLRYVEGAGLVQSALEDVSGDVRCAAAGALGRLGMPDAVPGLLRLLDDPDMEVRNAAAKSLQRLAGTAYKCIYDVALSLEQSGFPEQRRNAAVLFAALEERDHLITLLKDENPDVRRVAVSSIGTLKITTVSECLFVALSDEDPDVRIAAAEALGELGDLSSLEPLKLALQDDDPWVQRAVLNSIAKLDSSHLLPVLKPLLASSDGYLTIVCLELLEHLTTPEALQLVEQALNKQDADAVTLARSILARHSLSLPDGTQ